MDAMTRVETRGSFWLLDDDNGRYCRMPKREQPREHGWGGPEAGPLEDLKWHPMTGWEILEASGRLIVHLPTDDERGVWVSAPGARIIGNAA